jgi:hypothetical protein
MFLAKHPSTNRSFIVPLAVLALLLIATQQWGCREERNLILVNDRSHSQQPASTAVANTEARTGGL